MPILPASLVTPYELVADEAFESIGLNPVFHDITTGLWQWVVPDGVYARVVSVFGGYTSGPASGGLTGMFLGFVIGRWVAGIRGSGTVVMDIALPHVQSANTTVEYLWALGINNVAVQDGYASGALPDMLWPPRTLISWAVAQQTAADAWNQTPTIIVDQYPWGSASVSRATTRSAPPLLT